MDADMVTACGGKNETHTHTHIQTVVACILLNMHHASRQKFNDSSTALAQGTTHRSQLWSLVWYRMYDARGGLVLPTADTVICDESIVPLLLQLA